MAAESISESVPVSQLNYTQINKGGLYVSTYSTKTDSLICSIKYTIRANYIPGCQLKIDSFYIEEKHRNKKYSKKILIDFIERQQKNGVTTFCLENVIGNDQFPISREISQEDIRKIKGIYEAIGFKYVEGARYGEMILNTQVGGGKKYKKRKYKLTLKKLRLRKARRRFLSKKTNKRY